MIRARNYLRVSRVSLMVAIFLTLVLSSSCLVQAQSNNNVLVVEVAVLPDAERYLAYLEHPAILVVALQNLGVELTSSGRLTVRDDRTLEFKSSVLQYRARKGGVFSYEAGVNVSLGLANTSFQLPVEIDATALRDGRIMFRAHLDLAKFVPSELTSRIRLKIESVATPQMQVRLIAYLDKITMNGNSSVDAAFKQVLIDHYNHALTLGAPGAREPGDAEPLSDQMLLFITLVIWLVIVPAVFIGRNQLRRFKKRRAAR
jgi:hypothetical protein